MKMVKVVTGTTVKTLEPVRNSNTKVLNEFNLERKAIKARDKEVVKARALSSDDRKLPVYFK